MMLAEAWSMTTHAIAISSDASVRLEWAISRQQREINAVLLAMRSNVGQSRLDSNHDGISAQMMNLKCVDGVGIPGPKAMYSKVVNAAPWPVLCQPFRGLQRCMLFCTKRRLD